MAEAYADRYPAIASPAACPACGSMDLHTPFRGRRTGLWLTTCRDCKTNIRSGQEFSVERRAVKYMRPTRLVDQRAVVVDDGAGFARVREARDEAVRRLNMRDGKLRQMREIGEEG